jgi:hypothetical protein
VRGLLRPSCLFLPQLGLKLSKFTSDRIGFSACLTTGIYSDDISDTLNFRTGGRNILARTLRSDYTRSRYSEARQKTVNLGGGGGTEEGGV